MRPFRIGLVLALSGLACESPGAGVGERPGPRKAAPADLLSVTIRNNCPEAVTVHVGPTAPASAADGFALSANGIEPRKMSERDRLWLLYRGTWSRSRSTRPERDGWVIEILGTCDGVAGRKGPL